MGSAAAYQRQKLLAPADARARWREAAVRFGFEAADYESRWKGLWRLTVNRAMEGGRPWNDAFLALVQDYVEARRAAFEYEALAARDPFPVNGAGRPMPHPAVAAAVVARREAREVLSELLLTPRSLRGAGGLGEADPVADEPELPAGVDGDQVGL